MPNYDSFLGAVLVGLLVAVALCGVALMQTFFYYRHSKRDRGFFKAIVAVITVLNLTQLGSVSYVLYFWLVSNFGNINVAHNASPGLSVQVVVSAFNDLLVRSFFARRVYILCGPKKQVLGILLAGIAGCASIIVFCMMSTYTIKVLHINSQPATPARLAAQLKLSWLLYSFYSLGAIADIVIAISLCVLLSRNRTGFKRTDDLVAFWMLFSMNSGAMTSVFALMCLLLYASRPATLYSLGASFVLNQRKLHVNSLLVSLNARGSLRAHNTQFVSGTSGVAVEGLSNGASGGPLPTNGTNSYSIPLHETHLESTKEESSYSDSSKPMDL